MAGNLPIKYDLVEQQLRERLLSGSLTGLLPGVRQLALEYDVNFMTVNKAINRLEKENLVYRIPRKGTFVRRQRNILVAYNDSSPTFFEFELYSTMIAAIQKEFARHNCFMIFENLYGKSKQTLENLFSRIDGLVLFSSELPSLKLIGSKPIVRTMGVIDKSNVDHISYDNKEVGVIAANYLMDKGHDTCAYIGYCNRALFEQRYENFRNRLIEKGKTCMFFDSPREFTKQSILVQLDGLAKASPQPTGIFCSTDFEVGMVFQFMINQGKRHNVDYQIIGCNNTRILGSYLPGTTPASIELGQKEIGSIAGKLLLQRIEGLESKTVKKIVTPKLVTPEQIEGTERL